jgi:hypothetical protein
MAQQIARKELYAYLNVELTHQIFFPRSKCIFKSNIPEHRKKKLNNTNHSLIHLCVRSSLSILGSNRFIGNLSCRSFRIYDLSRI